MTEATAAVFEIEQEVMFQHCDPAGIVFYPRYSEMLNATVERWWGEALGWPFARMHLEDRMGVPMASIQLEFHAPSRLGDRLVWRLEATRVGGSSMDLSITARSGEERRVTAKATIVHANMETMRPTRWPDWVREKLQGGDA